MEGRDKRLSRKVRRSYVISTMSITLVLFMLGVVSYVAFSALTAAHELQSGIVVSVEVADDMSPEVESRIVSAIEATEMSTAILYMSKQEKFADAAFRDQFEVDLDLLLGDNPLRNSYEVTLMEQYVDRVSVNNFCSMIRDVEGVEYIAVPPVDVVEGMHATLHYVSIGMLAFLGVLFIISMLLLNNTIRLAIYSKRYLINTMKLVGATKWHIMRPLLGTAFKQGVVSGVVAAILLFALVYGVDGVAPANLSLVEYYEVGVIVAALVVVGVVITVLFSIFAVNKFVNMKSNKIYLY